MILQSLICVHLNILTKCIQFKKNHKASRFKKIFFLKLCATTVVPIQEHKRGTGNYLLQLEQVLSSEDNIYLFSSGCWTSSDEDLP